MSHLFFPQSLASDGLINVTNNTTNVVINTDQEILIQTVLVQTVDVATTDLTFDITGFTSTTVHLRYSLNGTAINSHTTLTDSFYVVDSADVSYNPGSDPESNFVSTADDILIARLTINASSQCAGVTEEVNKSHLVVETVDSITHNANTTNNNDTTQLIITLNSAEAGVGVSGGSGSSGLVIERGSLTNYTIVFDDTDDMIHAGLIGNELIVPRFGATPVSGRMLFVDPSIGDELGQDAKLNWDKVNSRFSIDVSSPTESFETSGNVRLDQKLFVDSSSGTIYFNVDSSDQYASTGFASKIRALSAGGINIQVAESKTAGTAISFLNAINIDESGNVIIKNGTSDTYTTALTLNGDMKFQSVRPIVLVQDTGASDGFQLQLTGVVTVTNPLYRIIDIDASKTLLSITKNDHWAIDSEQVTISSNSTLNTIFRIYSDAHNAKIKLGTDSSAFDGLKHTEIYHEQSTEKLFITTLENGGNIHLLSKNNAGEASGSIVIGNIITPAYGLELKGKERITATTNPSLIFEETSQSNKQWHMYGNAAHYCIGENDTSSTNIALRIRSGKDIEFGVDGDFHWDVNDKKLGLRTTTPNYVFEIIDTIDAYQIGIDTSTGSNTAGMLFNTNASGDIKVMYRDNGIDKFMTHYNGSGAYFDIYNHVTSESSIKVHASSNDIEFHNGFYWDHDDATLTFGSRTDTGNSAYKGQLIIEKSGTLGSSGGLEFKTGGTNDGYGLRFTGYSNLGTETLFIGARNNDSLWTQMFSVKYVKSPADIFAVLGTPTSGGDATYSGIFKIENTSSIDENGGLEFKDNNSGDGTGARIFTQHLTSSRIVNDAGAQTLTENEQNIVFAHRIDNDTWDTAITIKYDMCNYDTDYPIRTLLNIQNVPLYTSDQTAYYGGLQTGDIYGVTSGNDITLAIRSSQTYT